jgi:transcriptional regulator with XRE-family HTH domain
MTQTGKNIKKIRNVKGLSQQAFAEMFDLTRGNISSYEESRAEPKIEIILRIANFFGIPLADFIEKDLSVNELLHYNTHLVIETEKLKITHRLAKVPFVPIPYIRDYTQRHADPDFLQTLPALIVPCNSKSELIALELESHENLPAGFEYRKGNILVFEHITKENIHRIVNRLGMMIDAEGIKFGIYVNDGKEVLLSLNEWVKYPFNIEAGACYKVLRASFRQEE